MQFSKLEACGNDFVIFGGPSQTVLPDKRIVSHICDRHYGIGADCAVFISRSEKADFQMHVYNPDGFEAEICGNALRCSAKYVCNSGYFKKRVLSVETNAGIRTIKIENDVITAEIGTPVIIKYGNLDVAGKTISYFNVSVGNPHCVIFVNNLSDEEFGFYGPLLERHSIFPEGTNVEFAKIVSDSEISMRVWERGIGETLSCSTGSCACVAAAKSIHRISNRVKVYQKGGEIEVTSKECGNMFISGTCNIVFNGYIN